MKALFTTALAGVVLLFANSSFSQDSSIQPASNADADYYVANQDESSDCDAEVSCDSCSSCGCSLGLCDLGPSCCCIGEPWELFGESCCGINVGGWLQMGYHSNETPLSFDRGDGGAFNDVSGSLNAQQAWLYFEKSANSDCCGCDWGFRFDVVYGTDAQKTQAFGNGDADSWDNDWDHGVYGLAIPQLYGEIACGDLTIKAGHFFTSVGYEVIPATGNFFYSHSLTMFNAEPFTHTGVLATYSASDQLTLSGGWVAGWDTGFDSTDAGSMFLGGFSYSNCCDTTTLTYITTFGDTGERGDDAYSHSLVLDVTLSDNLNYVLQSDYVSIDGTGEELFGVNQYLFYTCSDCLKYGLRYEWLEWDDDDLYEAAIGINYRKCANLVIRPEVRWDWMDDGYDDETTFAVDAILHY